MESGPCSETAMLLEVSDYNGSERLFSGPFESHWTEIASTVAQMLMHVKASDQAGISGTPIFDPVGTNKHLRSELIARGWRSKIAIPSEYGFWGTDIDFGKNSTILEVQFSNYPFLLNNILRAEFFFRETISLEDNEVRVAIIITKAHMFRASNSTLYFEQAKQQLDGLSRFGMFNVPIRLVGLFECTEADISCVWTEYTNSRYSRTVRHQQQRECRIVKGQRRGSRCCVTFPP